MEIGELFAEKGEPPRQNRSASDTKGSRISPRLVPRPADVSSGSRLCKNVFPPPKNWTQPGTIRIDTTI